MRIGQSLLQDLGNVQISQFVRAILTDEDIGSLEVAMEDLLVMKGLKSASDVDEGLPDVGLLDSSLRLEMLINDLHEVAAIGKLHDDAEITGGVVVECLLELDDVVVAEGGQDSDLVKCIFFLFLLHARDAHLLQRVDLVVLPPPHLIDLSKRTLAYLFNYLEVLQVPLFTLHY